VDIHLHARLDSCQQPEPFPHPANWRLPQMETHAGIAGPSRDALEAFQPPEHASEPSDCIGSSHDSRCSLIRSLIADICCTHVRRSACSRDITSTCGQ
jgi:hypothetical protein